MRDTRAGKVSKTMVVGLLALTAFVGLAARPVSALVDGSVALDSPSDGFAYPSGTVTISPVGRVTDSSSPDQLHYFQADINNGVTYTNCFTSFSGSGLVSCNTPSVLYAGTWQLNLNACKSNAFDGCVFEGPTTFVIPDASLHIDTPTSGQTFATGSAVTASATVSGFPTVAHVEFDAFRSDDLTLQGSCVDTSAPFSCNINGLGDGHYYMDAIGRTSSDAFVTTDDGNKPFTMGTGVEPTPTYVLLTPTRGQHFASPSDVLFSSTVETDPAHRIDHVSYSASTQTTGPFVCVGNNAPNYQCTVTGLTSGFYTVLSIAYDAGAHALAFDDETAAVNSRTFTVGTPPPTHIPPSTIVATTGVVGFHVDPTGNTMITRVDDGHVNTYSAGGALPLLGTTQTNCANTRAWGVHTLANYVAYIQCETDHTTVHSFNVRSTGLGPPTEPPVCNTFSGNFCVMDIPDASIFGQGALAGNHDADNHLDGVADFPVDYSNNQGNVGDGAVWMAFAFTTTTGDVGVVSYVMQQGSVDTSAEAVANVGTTSLNAFCSVRDHDGRAFLYAADIHSNVAGYQVTFTNSFNAFTGQHTLTPHLNKIFSGTTATAGPAGIGCGDGKFAVLNLDALTVWARDATVPSITKIGITGATNNGVTMSADGGWVAYGNGTDAMDVLNSTTGARVATVDLGSGGLTGGFIGADWQGHGCNLWAATSVARMRFDLAGFTTPQCRSYTPAGGGTGGDVMSSTGGAGNDGGVGVVNTGSALGQLVGAGAVVLGAIVVGYALTANRRRRREEL